MDAHDEWRAASCSSTPEPVERAGKAVEGQKPDNDGVDEPQDEIPSVEKVPQADGTPQLDWSAFLYLPIPVDSSPRLHEWDGSKPQSQAAPEWKTSLKPKEKTRLPAQVQTALSQLAQDGPNIWRAIKGNEGRMLADDVEALRAFKLQLSDLPEALRFIKDKETLAADWMYAFAQCEAGYDGQPLMFMHEATLLCPYARLTSRDLDDARQELDDDNFEFERRELYEYEYDLVSARFKAAVERSFPAVAESLSSNTCSLLVWIDFSDQENRQDCDAVYAYAESHHLMPEPLALKTSVPTGPGFIKKAGSIYWEYVALHNLLFSFTRNPTEALVGDKVPLGAIRKRAHTCDKTGSPYHFWTAKHRIIDLNDRRCQVIQRAAYLLVEHIIALWATLQASVRDQLAVPLRKMLTVGLQTHLEGWTAYRRDAGDLIGSPHLRLTCCGERFECRCGLVSRRWLSEA